MSSPLSLPSPPSSSSSSRNYLRLLLVAGLLLGRNPARCLEPTARQDFEPEPGLRDPQSLQLILAKLIPNLWGSQPANATNAASTYVDQINELHQQQASNQGPYMTAANQQGLPAVQPATSPRAPTYSWLPARPAHQDNQQATSSQPVRQLISAHSNNLYYPPNEAHQPANVQLQQQQLASYPTQQHQQTFHFQPTSFNQPVQLPTTNYPAPSRPHFSVLQPLQRPALTQQQQYESPASALLAFLAQNKANLLNLIQLLPLIVQTLAILPKVFNPQGIQPGLALELLASKDANIAGNSNSSSPSGVAAAPSQQATDQKLSERLQAAAADSIKPASSPLSALFGQTGWPQLLSKVLPRLNQLLQASQTTMAANQFEFGQQQPSSSNLIYSMAPQAQQLSAGLGPGNAGDNPALGWLKNLIGSLGRLVATGSATHGDSDGGSGGKWAEQQQQQSVLSSLLSSWMRGAWRSSSGFRRRSGRVQHQA